MCDDIAVMYLGQIVEQAPREALFLRTLHPYTLALWLAAPSFDPGTRSRRDRIRLRGDPPSPINVPSGCRFAGRCPLAEARCHAQPPPGDRCGSAGLPVAHLTCTAGATICADQRETRRRS